MRKRLWQLHSWCGLVAGLGLLLIGVSGSILVFRAEVDRMLNPELRRWYPPVGASRLGFDELFARVRAQFPKDEVVGWETFGHAEPDMVALEPRGDTGDHWVWLRVDPFTGRALTGDVIAPRKSFTDWLLDLHVSLFLSDWGTVLNGFFAALLCVLGISGVYLYRNFWRHFFRLRWRASVRIFSSDLHKAVGISAVAFNLVLGFTGAYWNLPTLATLLGPASPPPAAAKPAVGSSLYNAGLSVDGTIARAQQVLPAMSVSTVYLNFPPRYERISVKGRLPSWNPWRGTYGGEVTFDPQDGRVLLATDIRTAPFWTQIEDMMTPLHFGTFGGLPIKMLWCLGGLTPGTLAISGAWIAFARKRRAVASSVLTRPAHP